MNYAEFVADLPPDHLSFSCVEENEEVLKRYGVTQEEKQLGAGRFQADLAATSVDEVELYSDRFDTAVSLYCQPPEKSVALLLTRSAEGEYYANGLDVTHGGLVFIPNGCGPDIVARGLFGSDSIIVPEERFYRILNTACPGVELLDTVTILPVDDPRMEKLQQEIVSQLNQGEAEPERVIELTETLITHLGESLHGGRLVPETALCRRRIAKQAQEFIEAHYADPIHIEDICRTTGAGVRTLQRAFREYFDVTITEYIKTVRLDMVFRTLTAAHPSDATITGVALDHGFTHLGRFSVMYGERFGESPSATLIASPVISQIG